MKVPKGFWIIVGFALFLMASGYMGYKAGGSRMSLIAGAFFGTTLLITCGGLLYQKRWSFYALWVHLVTLLSLFTTRSFLTHKPVPIFLALVTGAVFVALLIRNPSKNS